MQGDQAAAVREYISTETLKTVITSMNDGYWADYQPHLAHLVATIWLAYGHPAHVAATETQPAHDRPAWTDTPATVLLSLPGMTETRIKQASADLMRYGPTGSAKKIRAVVLQLLEGVRGVRLSELGKIDTRHQQSRILEKYKQRESLSMQGVGDESKAFPGDDNVDLGGVADMFG